MGYVEQFMEEQRLARLEKERLEGVQLRRNTVTFKALRPRAIIPTKGSSHAAAFDLIFCPSIKEGEPDDVGGVFMQPGEIRAIPTGISVALPADHHGQVWARSGKATKMGLTTEAGIIDEDYRGEIFAICANRAPEVIFIGAGDAVAQLVIVRTPQLAVHVCAEDEELVPCGTRGANGFGSTGR